MPASNVSTPPAKTSPSEGFSRTVLIGRIWRKCRRSENIEPIAFALDGADGRRSPGHLQLLAQARDVDVDQIGAGIEIIAPDILEDHAAADHLAGMAGKKLEPPGFPVQQLDPLPLPIAHAANH